MLLSLKRLRDMSPQRRRHLVPETALMASIQGIDLEGKFFYESLPIRP